MFKIKLLLVFYCFWFLSCTNPSNENLSINFSSDSAAIVIKNIEPANLYQIKSNIKTDTTYQSLVSVLQTPAEDDSTSMEIEWPGKLIVSGNALLFMPQNPFVKGKTYLVETIVNAHFGGANDIVKSQVGHKINAQQQTLKR